MNPIAKTPSPPYYVVIFTSKRANGDNGYAAFAEEVLKLAEQQPGFLGAESVRDQDGVGITFPIGTPWSRSKRSKMKPDTWTPSV